MEAITVKQLADQLNKLIKEGKGNYQVFVTDDEECNGFHAAWYLGTVADELSEEDLKMWTEINSDASVLKDPKKAVYIG